jgi:uroporphyrinogen decarboxylase
MSPDTWRRFFKPYVKKMYDFARRNNAYTKTHCDGDVTVLLPDFIEIGLDLFDPLMPSIPAMNPYKIIPQYHKSLVFNGTIDTQGFLQEATVRQVKDEVKKQLSAFEPYGGFVLCPSHMIQPGTPLENIIAIYDAVKEYYD